LELQDVSVGNRYDSCITGIRLNDLFNQKDEILEEIREIPGRLLIKEYPTKSATTKTIRNHLEKLQQRDIDIGMVIVDYGDILKPIFHSKEKRDNLETIYEELRAIAQEFECPVWTASQTNRSGINAEVITMESISEAYSKCFVADFIFSVSRTVADKMNNTGRIFIAKNRNGIDGVVYPIFMDAANVDIKVLPQINLTSSDDKLSAIQEKYKEWRGTQNT
jgi:replicative DNA helicase